MRRPTPPPADRRPAPRRRLDERGVALIMVTAVVAILTAVAVEFTWRERVTLHLAANARDELRAEYLARSAVNLGRTLLAVQTQLEGTLNKAANELAKGAGGNGAPPSLPSLQLWNLVPIDCGLLQMAVQGFAAAPEPAAGAEGAPTASFGDFSGGCLAEIQNEEKKINLNHLNGLKAQQQNAITGLLTLMSDPNYDFLFQEEDRWGVRLTREELVAAIKDFIDADQTQDSLVPGENGLFSLVPGSGDEGYYYGRIEPRQGPKNAPLDSIEELARIPGIGDYFLEAFGDQLTVYTGKNAKLLIDPNRPQDLCLLMGLGAQDPGQALTLCSDPVFLQGIWDQLEESRGGLPFMSITPEAFKLLLEQNGIATNTYAFQGTNAVFSTSARTFTIIAKGQAGDVEKTIEAVVSFDDGGEQGQSSPLGRLLHWEEK